MTASILLAMAQQYAMETELSVDEARASRAYTEMLMRRIETELADMETSFRNGDTNPEHRAD